jgi:type VI secretion system protein ImpB
MADGSTPPQERINVKYIPATKGKPEKELPFKLLMVGDYTGKPDDRPLEERAPVEIDKDTFTEVMRKHNLTLPLGEEDYLSEEDEKNQIKKAVVLSFNTPRDFEPSSIIKQVPRLRRLLELRQALEALKQPVADKREFRRELQRILNDEQQWKRLLAELKLEDSQNSNNGPEPKQ